jgi:hypothetical protein
VIPNSSGGLPGDVFVDHLGVALIWVPHSYNGCKQHGPDEHLLIAPAREGIAAFAGIWWDLGRSRRPNKPTTLGGALTYHPPNYPPMCANGPINPNPGVKGQQSALTDPVATCAYTNQTAYIDGSLCRQRRRARHWAIAMTPIQAAKMSGVDRGCARWPAPKIGFTGCLRRSAQVG